MARALRKQTRLIRGVNPDLNASLLCSFGVTKGTLHVYTDVLEAWEPFFMCY